MGELGQTLIRENPPSAASLRGRTGVVRNPLSRRNRGGRHEGWWSDIADPALTFNEPATPEELTEALKDFARREVGLVVVDGGDGTVREVLSALPEAYGDAPPALAVLSSGTTNLIAADVGAGRPDPATVAKLRRIAAGESAAARIERRATLKVSWPDASQPTIHGMFAGACAFTRATDLSVKLMREGRVDEEAGLAVTFLSSALHTLTGPGRAEWLAGDPMGLAADGGPVAGGRHFLFLATTLETLMLGVWPFWGEGEGPLRYLDIAAPPRRLLAALPAALRGRPRPWMAQAGYRSGAARALDLVLHDRFMVDGESYAPGAGGRVRLSAGQDIAFVIP